MRLAWSTSTQAIVTIYLSYKVSAEIESTSAKHDYDEGMLVQNLEMIVVSYLKLYLTDRVKSSSGAVTRRLHVLLITLSLGVCNSASITS